VALSNFIRILSTKVRFGENNDLYFCKKLLLTLILFQFLAKTGHNGEKKSIFKKSAYTLIKGVYYAFL